MLSTIRLICISLVIVACGNQGEHSQTKIINGIVTTPDTDEFPAVVNVINYNDPESGYCTGTFISDSVLLTAAHCMQNATPANVKVGEISSVSLYVNQNFKVNSDDKSTYDLALVLFPRNTSQDHIKISDYVMQGNEKITMVGFGHSDYSWDNTQQTYIPSNCSNPKIKRVGFNSFWNIPEAKERGVFWTTGNTRNRYIGNGNGEVAATAPGDSGGPLIYEEKLVGVCSSGAFIKMIGIPFKKSTHVNLLSTQSQDFFKKARALGFSI